MPGSFLSHPPEPEAVRRLARDILARPDYQLESEMDPDRGLALLTLLLEALAAVLRPIQALFQWLHGMHPLLGWGMIALLVLILLALVAHIVYAFKVALSTRVRDRRLALSSAERADPETLERQAEEAAQRHDYIAAVRLLFRACLARLERAEPRPFRPGLTNREHLRRYRNSPFFEPLKLFVEVIDEKWYGRGDCGPADYELCRRAHARIGMERE